MKRNTKNEGIKREYYNSLFTDIQAIYTRLQSWSLPVKSKATLSDSLEGIIPEANELEKMQLLMVYHQAEQQKKYTLWFIVLTILIIILTAFQFFGETYLTISPPTKKADIQLYTDVPKDRLNLSDDFIEPKFSLYLFNGGNAPCFDTVLTTHSFIQGGEMIIPERRIIPALVFNSKQESEFYLGVINPDETIKIELDPISLSQDQLEYLVSRKNPSLLKVKCVDDSSTKKIFLTK